MTEYAEGGYICPENGIPYRIISKGCDYIIPYKLIKGEYVLTIDLPEQESERMRKWLTELNKSGRMVSS